MAIKKAELQAGMIVWLRKPLGNYDPRLPNDHHGANNEYGVLGIDLDGCGRPVVILDMMPENEHRVWACTLTTFQKKDIEESNPHYQKFYVAFVPLPSTKDHPEICLSLKHDVRMRLDGWADIRKHAVPVELLRPCRQGRGGYASLDMFILDMQSLDVFRNITGFDHREDWVPDVTSMRFTNPSLTGLGSTEDADEIQRRIIVAEERRDAKKALILSQKAESVMRHALELEAPKEMQAKGRLSRAAPSTSYSKSSTTNDNKKTESVVTREASVRCPPRQHNSFHHTPSATTITSSSSANSTQPSSLSSERPHEAAELLKNTASLPHAVYDPGDENATQRGEAVVIRSENDRTSLEEPPTTSITGRHTRPSKRRSAPRYDANVTMVGSILSMSRAPNVTNLPSAPATPWEQNRIRTSSIPIINAFLAGLPQYPSNIATSRVRWLFNSIAASESTMSPDLQLLIEATLYHASASNAVARIPFRDDALDRGHAIGHIKEILSIRLLNTLDGFDAKHEHAASNALGLHSNEQNGSERVVLLQPRNSSKIEQIDTTVGDQTWGESMGQWGRPVAVLKGSVKAQ